MHFLLVRPVLLMGKWLGYVQRAIALHPHFAELLAALTAETTGQTKVAFVINEMKALLNRRPRLCTERNPDCKRNEPSSECGKSCVEWGGGGWIELTAKQPIFRHKC